MKVQITGASAFVDRMFAACGPYQWAREFLKNSLEAEASKVEFGIEWQAVEQLGVYRRYVADNGIGMDAAELLKYFATLGEGAKKIGGVHDNYGVGSKVASLPWNPNGIVVISFKNGKAAMIWILLDPESGDYELREFQFDEGAKTCVVDPSQIVWADAAEIDWNAVAPEWIREHGTVVVLLGSEEFPDTVLGNPHAGEKDIKGLSVFLNWRFWDLTGAEVRVVELRSEKKNSWPTGPGEKDDARRPNNRQVMGARYYLTDVKATEGKLGASGELLLDSDRVTAEWYLWEGQRPRVDAYAKRNGYIAIRYNGELYQLTAHKVHWRMFGVIEGKVQANTWVILEPPHYMPSNGRWGIHPDQSRTRLIFTGNGDKGAEVPLSDWGMEFAENMPDAIREAISVAREGLGGSVEDEEYRKRLQDKFGNRWSVKTMIMKPPKQPKGEPATATDGKVEVPDTPDVPDIETDPNRQPRIRRRHKPTLLVVRKKASPGGSGERVEVAVPVDMPRYEYGSVDDFEKPWHLAVWAPRDVRGPTVILNRDAPILQEVIRYHQEQYPLVFAEEVEKEVKKAYGEVAVSKVAHAQRLAREVPEEEVDRLYRSEEALTVALMGLLAEESLIAVRLGRLGRKKTVA